jgi:hypothetical protein
MCRTSNGEENENEKNHCVDILDSVCSTQMVEANKAKNFEYQVDKCSISEKKLCGCMNEQNLRDVWKRCLVFNPSKGWNPISI